MNIIIDQTFPEFEIEKGGIATVEGKFEAWNTDELQGQPTLVLINSGYPEANDMHQEFSMKVAATDDIRLARIINSKDAPMGAGIFIKSEFKKGVKGDSKNVFVLDAKGVVAKKLNMAKKSCVVAVIDSEGKVLFANEGQMTDELQVQALGAIAATK